jgi:hypothetical protein
MSPPIQLSSSHGVPNCVATRPSFSSFIPHPSSLILHPSFSPLAPRHSPHSQVAARLGVIGLDSQDLAVGFFRRFHPAGKAVGVGQLKSGCKFWQARESFRIPLNDSK